LPEEKKIGGTVYGKTFHSWKKEENMVINLIDTPGNAKYSKNKIANLVLGDVGVLCMSAERGTFDLNIYNVSTEFLLAISSGLKHMVVVLTFMDKI
jgi:translation elongation factor EF-1alpha